MEAPVVVRLDLLANHDEAYVDDIEEACAAGGAVLDPDTRVGPISWEASLRSAGGGPAASAALRAGKGDMAFIVTRPPGHHALAGRAMGFCIFNNIAIAARALTSRGQRVAIVDWDVHHGNGTQDAFYDDPDVLYVSLHESGFYPGTGHEREKGSGRASGTTMNLPLPAGTSGDVYRWLTRWLIRPAIESFSPDWLLISAGYDAHRDDPLAGMNLIGEDYAVMAYLLRDTVVSGRIIGFLEGGYDLSALTESVAATLRGFDGKAPAPPERDEVATNRGWRTAVDLLQNFG